MVFDHVRQTIDVAIGSSGKASGLTEQAVKDLTKRMPQTSPYESFVMDLLMSRVLIDQVEESFSAKIAADILARLTRAKSWLSAWKAEHGDAASLFFERGGSMPSRCTWTRRPTPQQRACTRQALISSLS